MQNKLTITKAEEGEIFQGENDNSSNRESKGNFYFKYNLFPKI